MVSIVASHRALDRSPGHGSTLGGDHDDLRAFGQNSAVHQRSGHTERTTGANINRLELVREIQGVQLFNIGFEVSGVVDEL